MLSFQFLLCHYESWSWIVGVLENALQREGLWLEHGFLHAASGGRHQAQVPTF